MDWRRAKTILIAAFLLLDSFLAYQLWVNRGAALEFTQQVEGTTSSFQDMLKAQEIELAVEIPTDMPEMYYLNVRYEDFKTDELRRLPNQTIRRWSHGIESELFRPFPSFDQITKSEFSKRLADHILFIQEYEIDPVLSHSGRIVYLQRWDSYPFFGGILELDITDQKVWKYRQSRFEVVNKGSGKKVISSLTALRTLVENQVIKNAETIHAIQLGYFGHTYDADIQVLAPVWRFIYGDDQVQYVNGITGVIEKVPAMAKKEG